MARSAADILRAFDHADEADTKPGAARPKTRDADEILRRFDPPEPPPPPPAPPPVVSPEGVPINTPAWGTSWVPSKKALGLDKTDEPWTPPLAGAEDAVTIGTRLRMPDAPPPLAPEAPRRFHAEPPVRSSDAYEYIPPGTAAPAPAAPSAGWLEDWQQRVLGGGHNILTAARRGYDEGNVLAPEAQTWLDKNVPPAGVLMHDVNALTGLGSGAFRGAQEAVNQTAGAIDPRLGRDLAGGLEGLPGRFGVIEGRGMPMRITAPRVNPLDAAIVADDIPTMRVTPEPRPEPVSRPAPVGTMAERAPEFVPPGTDVPVLSRIRELIEADNKVAANRPDFVPPGAKQPPNPLDPGTRVVPRAEVNNPLSAETATPRVIDESAVPRSGAAAATDPAAAAADTPRQALTNLGKSVNQTALERAGPGMEDHTVYVPGVERPMAARVFTPANALDDKVMRASDPMYREAVERVENRNNETMVELLRDHAGDDNTLGALYDARDAVAPPALKLFAEEKPVSASPLVKQIDAITQGPAGKRSAVSRVMKDVRDKLFDADGNLETLPSQLYGARQNITDLLKKGAKGLGQEADDARLVKSELTDLLKTIDPIIGEGAPKFQDYLKDFAEASKPINAQEFLQPYVNGSKKVTGTGGKAEGVLQLTKVQKLLETIRDGRAAKGVHPAKSLTEEQINDIVAVRNELAALGLKDKLASVKGADTFQQTNRAGLLGEGPLGMAVKGGAELALHAAILHSPLAGVGNLARAIHQGVVRPAKEAAAARKQANVLAQRKNELLNTQPNPLLPPDAR